MFTGSTRLNCLPMYAAQPGHQQLKVFHSTPEVEYSSKIF